jgi:hypothetical protein
MTREQSSVAQWRTMRSPSRRTALPAVLCTAYGVTSAYQEEPCCSRSQRQRPGPLLSHGWECEWLADQRGPATRKWCVARKASCEGLCGVWPVACKASCEGLCGVWPVACKASCEGLCGVWPVRRLVRACGVCGLWPVRRLVRACVVCGLWPVRRAVRACLQLLPAAIPVWFPNT